MKSLFVIALLFWCSGTFSQSLSGQWRGSFNSSGNIVADNGGTEYVLELEVNGNTITGFSYTYFEFPGRKCYVICRLEGSYEPDSKSMVVTEVEKVKSNTPPNFIDCLQTHILTFLKQGNTEKLVGRWKPARKIDNCGTGSTELERKVLTKIAPPKNSTPLASENPENKNPEVKNPDTKNANNSTANAPKTNPKPKSTTSGSATAVKPKPKTTSPPVAKTTTKPKQSTTSNTTTTKKNLPENKETIQKPLKVDKDTLVVTTPELPKISEKPLVKGYENRSKDLLKTIEVSPDEFRVDLYDNGEIDGDSISVFFNGKLLLSHQRLSDKAITLMIKIDPNRKDNDLVMYAENLGSIPPNTALMVVTVGEERYEVRITSTEQTSGTVRFKLKE